MGIIKDINLFGTALTETYPDEGASLKKARASFSRPFTKPPKRSLAEDFLELCV
jgi:hypothetical protein